MVKGITWKSTIPSVQVWGDAGDQVEGWLIGSDMTAGPSDQLRGEYLVDTADGIRLIFGTAKIDQGLSRVDLGSYVRITYLGEEETRRGFSIKLFDVEVGSGDAVDTATGEITANPS